MPMLTTLRIAFPVWPCHSPERMRSAKTDIRSSTAFTSATTSTPSTTKDSPRGIRSATCSTDRCSVALIRSPRNIASIRSWSRDSLASCTSRAIVSAVIRFFE